MFIEEDEILDNETESEDSTISDDDQDEYDDEEADDESGTSGDDDSEDDSEDDGDEEPWVVPGRFRTVEDLKNSYAHLERGYHQKSQEAAQLAKLKETPVDPEARIKAFQEKAKTDPIGALKDLNKEELDDLREKHEETQFALVYKERMQDPDFKRLEPIMAQIANEYRDTIETHNLRRSPELLSMLFEAAKGREKTMDVKNAEKRGKEAGAKAARKKAKAKVEGAGGSKGKTKVNFDKLTSEEMEALINKGEISV